ncbi:MAG TPA: alpha/beta hydrolase [Acidobacteriota bacterium]|nr:alpha/beta hydrolase [Acidobacteriota bacterium]HNJ41644.1 alpha/beta hydrolase [Acidobacteriota bacterium]
MTLNDWKTRGKFFTYRGHQIFYRDEGTGFPVLCIHGFPTASWDWHCVWPELTSRFRVVALDMIGFGFSDKPHAYDYSIMDQATLHETFLEYLKIDRAHIFAHDYGDTVAQELLARCEDRSRQGQSGLEIKSVCFLNGGLFPEVHRARFIQKLLNSPLGSLIGKMITKEKFCRSLSAVFGPKTQPSTEELAAFWTLNSTNQGTQIAHKLIRYIGERKQFRERWVGTLQQTRIPLRVINGLADPVSGAHMVERYRELISNPDVVGLEGIGHYPQVEAPAAVLEGFLSLIGKIERDRSTPST